VCLLANSCSSFFSIEFGLLKDLENTSFFSRMFVSFDRERLLIGMISLTHIFVMSSTSLPLLSNSAWNSALLWSNSLASCLLIAFSSLIVLSLSIGSYGDLPFQSHRILTVANWLEDVLW